MEETSSPTGSTGTAAKAPGVVRSALISVSFIEKAVLIILTALISGLLIPYVSNKIQTANAHREIVLQSESKLLDDITNTIITYEFLVADVSYYKSDSTIANDKMQALAFERYSNRVVDLFSQWGVEVAKAKNLTSPEISDKLNKFMNKVLDKQDAPLLALFSSQAPVKDWMALNDLNGKMYEEAKGLINELAVDLKITNTSIK
jgi:cell division protein FtsL